ncbi:porin [Shewanella intestini]|uniref:Porin n=1 Tax=Shewanella intestini TaxID=2017544 RepID=A0ABS5I024_9GAMM|nr:MULTISPECIES: porin [Shewanella]MBR9727384.1 porin [Shewanella intestini]MRG35566.1 porin [Shewanella sp. XMDDZSB0408]
MMKALSKTIIATAVTVATMSTAYAAEPLTVYGKLNVTAQSNDVADESETTIQSNASRFGVKGGFELNDALEAFYTVEYQVDTGKDSSSNFTARNQFVGLKGQFGSISVGRNDTLLKKSQGKVDLFNDLEGDLKTVFAGENRLAQTATYLTPSFSNFTAGVTYVADGDVKQSDNGFSLAAMYGDSGLKKSPVYAAIAYDSKVNGYDIVRATLQGKIVGIKLGAMYQQQEELDTDVEDKGFLVSASYGIEDITLKAQYQDMDNAGDSWSIGADYKLGKPTKLFAFYTTNTPESGDDEENYLGLGLEHKF